jgi:tRNA 2-selenouridine synthase
MTLIQKSSVGGSAAGEHAHVESLAGAFHPHAIEVQDFPCYRVVIDLRSAAAYEDDHIPGAVYVDSSAWAMGMVATRPGAPASAPLAVHEPQMPELPAALLAAVASVRQDQAQLVYCDQGGRVSGQVARALRWRGWTVDVLPGGWINYRRWVLAGLEVLPRLVPFLVIASALGSETARILAALRDLGQQVLDIEALAGVRRNSLSASTAPQPAQAWFDSQLLQALRALDPRAPVWVADTGGHIGRIAVPGALQDALAIAPMGQLQVDLAVRAAAWAEDEPLCGHAQALIEAVLARDPQPLPALVAQWQDSARKGDGVALLCSVLGQHLDPVYQKERAGRAGRAVRQHALPRLQVDALSAAALAETLRPWVPAPGDGLTA